MKKFFAVILAALMLVSVVGCTGGKTTEAPKKEQGKVFNIYAWNEEFKGFFEKYYKVPEGVTVNWIINPSDGGVYQQKLDEALVNQANAAADDKIDMFLAEADYIGKYVDSDYTMDVTSFGFKNADTMYDYTIKAASDSKGVCKGVSFQCCPAAVIYRKSIAKDVLGTDVPEEVQAQIDSWEKFERLLHDRFLRRDLPRILQQLHEPLGRQGQQASVRSADHCLDGADQEVH